MLATDDTDTDTDTDGGPWGLARISYRKGLDLRNVEEYLRTHKGGEGVDVYTLDTGTNTEHVSFEGRAHWGTTIKAGAPSADDNGHGTYCSGTVMSKEFGVAKFAEAYAVKVLGDDGSGYKSDAIKALDWTAQRHTEQLKLALTGKRKGFRGSVANLSFGGRHSRIENMAVDAAVDTGLYIAVAAGNDRADACDDSPASAKKAITGGASTLDDEFAYFSNRGPCMDLIAPGVNIFSTWIGSKYAIDSLSGTSMATPHVVGLLAYMLSLLPPIGSNESFTAADLSPARLKSDLMAISTYDYLTEVPPDTVNFLAWNGGGSKDYAKIIEKGGWEDKGGAAQFTGLRGAQATLLGKMSVLG